MCEGWWNFKFCSGCQRHATALASDSLVLRLVLPGESGVKLSEAALELDIKVSDRLSRRLVVRSLSLMLLKSRHVGKIYGLGHRVGAKEATSVLLL
jgi:hypothetical protein